MAKRKRVVWKAFQKLSACLVLLLTLHFILEPTESFEETPKDRTSIMIALKTHQKTYPRRNTNGLPRHSRKVYIQSPHKLKAGLHPLKTALVASYLLLLAGDVISNPGPDNIFRRLNSLKSSQKIRNLNSSSERPWTTKTPCGSESVTEAY